MNGKFVEGVVGALSTLAAHIAPGWRLSRTLGGLRSARFLFQLLPDSVADPGDAPGTAAASVMAVRRRSAPRSGSGRADGHFSRAPLTMPGGRRATGPVDGVPVFVLGRASDITPLAPAALHEFPAFAG